MPGIRQTPMRWMSPFSRSSGSTLSRAGSGDHRCHSGESPLHEANHRRIRRGPDRPCRADGPWHQQGCRVRCRTRRPGRGCARGRPDWGERRYRVGCGFARAGKTAGAVGIERSAADSARSRALAPRRLAEFAPITRIPSEWTAGCPRSPSGFPLDCFRLFSCSLMVAHDPSPIFHPARWLGET